MTFLLPLLLLTAPVRAEEPSPYRFSTATMDRTADPCADFYQFACGGWMKNTAIPADQSRWGRFFEVGERNRQILHDILEGVKSDDKKRDALDRKIGDYYYSCMDEAGIEKKGLAPLKPLLARIDKLERKDLPAELAALHSDGVDAAFVFGSGQDYENASQVIAQADQGGLGLPDRDYYLKTDDKSVKTRQAYETHVKNMFALAGEPENQAADDAATVLAFEVSLASASQDRVFRRDPKNLVHRLTADELAKLAPGFDWRKYFADVKSPKWKTVNVAAPDFFKELAALAQTEPIEKWRVYLRWHAIHALSPLLPKAFVDENFAFYGKQLTGAQELKARWKRCVDMTDGQLGEALGQRYVERTFGAEGKKRTLAMVGQIEAALKTDIEGVDWMTPETKKAALVKLAGIQNKIGYPDKWRDYSKYKVVRGDAVGNAIRGDRFEWHRQLAKIGKPVDKSEWDMTPPTVNAYYDPQKNNINFPAGILQPPFYDNGMDDAVNFGGIGAVIGHELTHGFDDEGRQFDAQGNLRDWWTPADAEAFNKRAQCFVDEYSSFVAVDDVHLNGKLTLGENTADNGGLRLAYMALMSDKDGANRPPVDGFTPEQRLFLGWGQVWCWKMTDEAARLQALTNPHSPGRDRVNGVVRNMPEFAKAFQCKAGAPMAPVNACRVW